jgi:hypothetical protein
MPEKKSAKKTAPKAKTALKAKPKTAPKPKPKTTPKAKPKTAPIAKAKAAAKKEAPKEQEFFRTGEKCPQSGLYMHHCISKAGEKNTIPLSKTETFPPCRSCGSVKWTLVMAA